MTGPEENNKGYAVPDLQALCREIAEHSFLPMVAVAGPEHLIRYVNPAFCTLAEKSSEELIGVPFDRVVPGGKVCLPLLERLYRTGEPQRHTAEGDPKGLPRWSYSLWAVPHAVPRPAGVLIQVADATRAAQSQYSVDVTRELMITAVRQHELLAAADRLSKELQKEIIERKRIETVLESSLEDKEMLLRELSHRTKNNMQVIGSLLSLQATGSGDKRIIAALADAQDRIRAMALVHESLYKSGNFSRMDMKEYVKDLVIALLDAHQAARGPVAPVLELEEVDLCLDAALPCGLIINELVSNSLKHAFRDRKEGKIFLSLNRRDGKVVLTYRDDGPGLPPELDPSQVRSLGLRLVHNLAVHQLRGTIELAHHSGGTEFVFRFPLPTTKSDSKALPSQ